MKLTNLISTSFKTLLLPINPIIPHRNTPNIQTPPFNRTPLPPFRAFSADINFNNLNVIRTADVDVVTVIVGCDICSSESCGRLDVNELELGGGEAGVCV